MNRPNSKIDIEWTAKNKTQCFDGHPDKAIRTGIREPERAMQKLEFVAFLGAFVGQRQDFWSIFRHQNGMLELCG